MTSFSPARARSCSLGIVTRMGTGILRPVEELAPATHGGDALDEEVEVLGYLDEVEALAVDDEERAVGVVEEIARVRLREAPQVVLGNRRLDGVAALPHAREQRVGRGLQVDHEVGHRRLGLHVLVDAAVELEFRVFEREPREERILGKRKVGDRGLLEEVGLAERLELADALEEEEELRGQRVAPHVAIELRQERVGLGILEEERRSEPLAELLREARLAAPDGALDDEVAMLHASRAASSRAVPRLPSFASGQISASGWRTKARSWARGCGTVSPGSSTARSP